MTDFTIGSAVPSLNAQRPHIYCPCLQGLSARLADAAILIPRMDNNQTIKDANGYGHWAATIAADPFGSNTAYFKALTTAGYKGVVNWPSAILLEGQTQQQMSTIPATPNAEYQYLAKAQTFGLQTLGFILTPDHAAAALQVGLDHLVLHPGVLLDVDKAGASMLRGALSAIITRIRSMNRQATVMLYTSDWHEQSLGLSEIACDGFVHFEGTQ